MKKFSAKRKFVKSEQRKIAGFVEKIKLTKGRRLGIISLISELSLLQSIGYKGDYYGNRKR